MRRQRLIVWIAPIIVFGLLAPMLLFTAPVGRTSPAATIPAPLPGVPRPTITVHVAHAYADQPVRVQGQGIVGSPGVRIAWEFGGATYTAVEVALASDLSYSGVISVPLAAIPGPAQVCAMAMENELAAMTCTPFMIDEAPTGSLSGQIPINALPTTLFGRQAGGATIRLINTSGTVIASTVTNTDGRFALANIPPGAYRVTADGNLGALVQGGNVTITPARQSVITLPRIPATTRRDPISGTVCDNAQAAVSWVSASRTVVYNTSGSGNGSSFAARNAGLQVLERNIKLPEALRQIQFELPIYFGLYLSGVALSNTFSANVQTVSGSVAAVEYRVLLADGSVRTLGRGNAPSYALTLDMGNLPPGLHTLYATPIMADGARQCPRENITMQVGKNPMDRSLNPLLQLDARTTWNDAARRYEFVGTIPNILDVLPFAYPEPFDLGFGPTTRLPFIGDIQSRLDLGVRLEGHFDMSGIGTFTLVQPRAYAKLLTRELVNQAINVTPPGNTLIVDPDNPRRMGVPFRMSRPLPFKYDRELFNGPIITLFKIISLSASLGIGLKGDLRVSGTIYPLEPEFDLRMSVVAIPNLYASLYVDVLTVASAGATPRTNAQLSFPMQISNRPNLRVGLNSPCLSFLITIEAWARVNYLVGSKTWSTGDYPLVNYTPGDSRCPEGATVPEASAPLPRVLASPDVATSSNGRALTVYVEDRAPNAAIPQPTVMARFWNSAANTWGPATPISSGRPANDPVAAFYGPDGVFALVAWSETVITPEEDAAAGDDINAIFNRQEIFFARWNGTNWSAPQRLTNNTVADGRAAIAGDERSATLAWVHDFDGDLATHTDARIMALHWNPAINRWTDGAFLGGGAPTAPGSKTIFALDRPITLDGVCSLEEYEGTASIFNYSDLNGVTGQVLMRHDGTNLYACVIGKKGSYASRSWQLYLDTNNAAEAAPQADDIYLAVGIPGDLNVSARGNSSGGYVLAPEITGWQARSTLSGNEEMAEYSIPLSLLGNGQTCGNLFGLELIHTWVTAPGNDYPAFGGTYNRPDTWKRFALECPGSNSQPSVARHRTADGRGSLVVIGWTYDADGTFVTGADRRIALATLTQSGSDFGGTAWRMVNPQPLPPRVELPSVALADTSGNIQLAFLQRELNADGSEGILGTNAVLWSANLLSISQGYTVQAAPLLDDAGQPVRGERPRLTIRNGEALIALRRFGGIGTAAEIGQLAVTRGVFSGSSLSFRPPAYLAGATNQLWQAAAALDPQSMRLKLVGVRRPDLALQATLPAAQEAGAGDGTLATLSEADQRVVALDLAQGGDPAIDPLLELSSPRAPVGATVTITATVRNIGRGDAPFTLQFRIGQPDGSTQTQQIAVASLPFNTPQQIAINIIAAGGIQPISAHVIPPPSGDNLSTENDEASAQLGTLSVPELNAVIVSPAFDKALRVELAPDDAAEADTGVRILRSTTPGGPYELVGESSIGAYDDLLLTAGQTYCYVAVRYDSGGNRSERSTELCAQIPLHRAYLPLLHRP